MLSVVRATPGPAARQRQHDPGFRVQRFYRFSRQAIIALSFLIVPALAIVTVRVLMFLDPGSTGRTDSSALIVWASRERSSWAFVGRFVAVALALKYPEIVRGLVLASGYYYPSLRLAVAFSACAVPVIGDVLRTALRRSSPARFGRC